ncbi:hypothetical protein SASPL_148520 [Salvia splendens]|uniref:RelA/SpoT domain-containing protein n=1 Tax=Salvia splendens TaxID=180675 RepID=A0A8X8W9W0_SALSN|nr:hypothetical protein SASPL_148520 [Salvia splendens]
MFLAMADARAVLIKLADRLHNMTTLEALPLIKQQRFSKETSEIFVPLANRLGASSWKEQLENLSFKHLNHDQYQELSSKLVKFFDEAVITSSVDKLEQALTNGAVSYSCRKKVNMEEVHDIHGLRLIVETREECYKALKIVQHLWHEVPGRFKDYIVYPKCNGSEQKECIFKLSTGLLPTGDTKKESADTLPLFFRWWQCEAMSKDRLLVGFFASMKPPCTFPTHSQDCEFSCKPQCGHNGPVFVIMIINDKFEIRVIRKIGRDVMWNFSFRKI